MNFFTGGESVLDKSEKEMRSVRGSTASMIFQDPMTALNPSMKVGEQVAEVIRLHKNCSHAEASAMAARSLAMVGIQENRLNDYPHQFSGGRRQRIGIARALALEPEFIVCDEPVSALDVSIQAQILNLLQDLQEQKKLTYMFITHDLSVVRHISNTICVMYLGQVIEQCATDELFENTLHPYSQALLSAIPVPSVDERPQRILLTGEVSSPIAPKDVCRFAPRCRFCTEDCLNRPAPKLRDVGSGHKVACHKI